MKDLAEVRSDAEGTSGNPYFWQLADSMRKAGGTVTITVYR